MATPRSTGMIAAALLWFVAAMSLAAAASTSGSSKHLDELERPFFNIAHMVNSIKEVDQYLRLGANAIEADVTFQSDGTAKQTFHGSPCDCFRNCYMRENIVDYLEYIRKITSLSDAKFKNRVALLFLDLKVTDLPADSKLKAGKDISKKLLEHLWYNVDTNNTVNVLLSIGHVSDKDVFKGVVETLMKHGDAAIAERIGFDVGLNDPLEEISKMYSELGIDHNRWQGDGVSNCLSLFRPANRLKQALRYRDSRTDRSYADKVYHWTIDLSSAIRNSIRIATGIRGTWQTTGTALCRKRVLVLSDSSRAKGEMILCYLFSSVILLGSIICMEKGGSPDDSKGGPSGPQHPNMDHRRPFYIIAHMVNSLEEVDEYLTKGANAIESNIEFDSNGTVLGTFHGAPCDCFRTCMKREKIDDFLEFIRDVTSFPDSEHKGKVTLLFLDLRTAKLSNKAKVKAGINIARSLVEYLWSDVTERNRINVLLSIPSVKERDVIRGAIAYIMQKASPKLLDNIGFDVGANEPLDKISQMYKRLKIRQHRWQGDGLSNCVRFIMPVERLLRAIRLRNAGKGFIDKVYHWTIDFPFYITRSIRHGVDGIISNRPDNVRMVVESPEFRNTLKVADITDNPWQNFNRGLEDVEVDRDTTPELLGGE